MRRLARSISAGVSNATSAAFTTSDVSGPGQERIDRFVVVQDAILLQEANGVRQPFSELGELVTKEVSLGKPNIVDNRLDTSLGNLSELDLDGSIASHRVNSEGVTFKEDGNVGRAASRSAVAVDISQSSSETLVTSEEVREKNVVIEDLDKVVSVASSVSFGKLEDSALNSSLVSDEDGTIVVNALGQLVEPSESFSLGGGDSQNASENS